ncbi:MAG: ribosome biogenesis GTP-binding protein YihA/YsxC [Holosporales bacterium]|jgi:GTP-binding protein
MINFERSSFALGVTDPAQLPKALVPEVALCGRSNVGKSSLINAITGRRALARVAKTPGQTQQINYYSLGDGAAYLVDLPGYGYAKVSKSTRRHWDELLGAYLAQRRQLACVLALVDGRHGVKANDHEFFAFLESFGVPFVVVMTKTDAVNAAVLAGTRQAVTEAVKTYAAAAPEILISSSRDKIGLDSLRKLILSRVGG